MAEIDLKFMKGDRSTIKKAGNTYKDKNTQKSGGTKKSSGGTKKKGK